MKKNLQRGFTLIELLVVIAIIGILASVVLASLNSARNKGADAKVKSELSNMRAQAEIKYDTNGSYVGVCTELEALVTLDGENCNVSSSNDAWAMEAELKSNGDGKFWCVDSTGKSEQNDATIGATATVC